MKRTKKYLEQENKWLWYYYQEALEKTESMEIVQYNKKGNVIGHTTAFFPKKKHRPKHPSTSEIKTNMFIRL